LEASVSWQLAQRFQRWRRVVAPPGGRRARLWRAALRRAHIVPTDGAFAADPNTTGPSEPGVGKSEVPPAR